MATVADLIERSLRTLGILAASETPKADQLTDGFLALNDMLDGWAAEGLDVSPFAATTDEVDLPPGYARALRYNLAVELADDYGVAVPPTVGGNAADSKTILKRTEFEPTYLESDPAILTPGTLDITSGD